MLNEQQLKQLDNIFNPRSIAVVGVTDSKSNVGYSTLEAIVEGGFKGKVYPVHPRHKEILGLPVYASIEDVPGPLDLVVAALNQYASAEIVDICAKRGVKGVILLAGGFKEMGEEGAKLERGMIETAQKWGCMVIGPNCLGFINTPYDLVSVFFPLKIPKGNISIITQSGGAGLTVLNRLLDENIGISKWIGVGNRGSLEFADYLQYLEQDPTTDVIGVLMEATDNAREFVEIARKTVKTKPVVVYKSGKSELAQYAALTHTGTLAGSPRMYEDAFHQYGVIYVRTLLELAAACKALSIAPPAKGDGIGMITHTAGPTIVMVDEISSRGCPVPNLSEEALRRVKELLGTKNSETVILKNPLDLAGVGFEPVAFGKFNDVLCQDPGIDIIIGVFSEHRNWRFPADEMIENLKKHRKPIIACFISKIDGVCEVMEQLHKAGIPVFTNPDEAAWGAAALAQYYRYQKKALSQKD